MKRLALAAIVLSIVACSGSQEETPVADTATVPAAAAPRNSRRVGSIVFTLNKPLAWA